MSSAQANYRFVRQNLKQMAEDYFAHLRNDPKLRPEEKEQTIIRDTHIFLSLARIYRDATTTTFIRGLPKQATATQAVYKRGATPTKTALPTKNKTLPKEKNKAQHDDFKPLEHLLEELQVDRELFSTIAGALGIRIVTKDMDGKIAAGVPEWAYQKITKYIKDTRT